MRRTPIVFTLFILLAAAATVSAQAPIILGVAPLMPLASSSAQPLSIAGAGFSSGMTVSLTSPSGTTTLFSGAQIQRTTLGAIEVQAVLADDGRWSVRVTNAAGSTSIAWGFIVRPAGPVAAPTIKPGDGTFSAAQTVTLACATSGATIRYTANGSAPSSSSPIYSAPFTVSSTTTIKAQAFKTGMANSVVTAAFLMFEVATPVLGPSGGSVLAPLPPLSPVAVRVTMTTATPGATITYTGDGSTPTLASEVYTGPVAVYSTTTLKARAFKAGIPDSGTAVGTYAIVMPWASPPVISPASGSYGSSQLVTITTPTAAAVIRYTTDGSYPTPSSRLYTAPLNVATTTTLRARAYASQMTESSIASATYVFAMQRVATPTATPGPGSFLTAQNVFLASATIGATIRYTIDGSSPTTASPVYTGPITVSATTVIKAQAFSAGMLDSSVMSAGYCVASSAGTGGCVTGSCEDGNFCTSADGKNPGPDTCRNGVCVGTPISDIDLGEQTGGIGVGYEDGQSSVKKALDSLKKALQGVPFGETSHTKNESSVDFSISITSTKFQRCCEAQQTIATSERYSGQVGVSWNSPDFPFGPSVNLGDLVKLGLFVGFSVEGSLGAGGENDPCGANQCSAFVEGTLSATLTGKGQAEILSPEAFDVSVAIEGGVSADVRLMLPCGTVVGSYCIGPPDVRYQVTLLGFRLFYQRTVMREWSACGGF
jgi:hypothetical protein